jgi:broad specificity phosphatase PhoE
MTCPGDAPGQAPRAVWIVRHGERRDFVDPSWASRAARPEEPPLAPRGVAQARALARRLRGEHIAHVFSSPFLRCVQTAQHVAAALDLRIKIEPGLSEWLSPAWFPQPPKLLSLDELARRFPRVDRTYRARGSAQYGESGDAALERSGATARRLVDEFRGHLLLVGHGASVLGATVGLLGVDVDAVRPALGSMPYAGIVKLVQHSATWALELASNTAHLATPVDCSRGTTRD